MNYDFVLIFLFSVLFFLFVINSAAYSSFSKMLKKRHSKVWGDLGEPVNFWDNQSKSTILIYKYLFSGRYKELSDNDISRKSKLILGSFFLYLIFFLVMVVVMLGVISGKVG